MVILFLVITRVLSVLSCSSSTGSRDNEIITDPTFSFEVSPPVRWTYYPVLPTTGNGQNAVNFFPGQSRTSQDALQAAQNEIMAAYLEAIASANYPVIGSQIQTTVTYSPDEISNCFVGAVATGTRIGFLSGGAITEVALVSGSGGSTASIAQCPLSETMVTTGIGPYEEYTKTVAVATRGGVTMTRYFWDRVGSEMQSILNFRYRALFTTPITISN